MMNLDIVSTLSCFGRQPLTHPPSFIEAKYRTWQLGLPIALPTDINGKAIPGIIAIGGGKGGVGKSMLSANLATSLGRFGRRVLVVDMDLGGANLHTHFGIPMPARTLADFVINKNVPINEVILPTSIGGVNLIAAGREEEWGGWLAGQQDMSAIWQALPLLRREYNTDYVIFDLGAGTSNYTMQFFSAAHMGITTVLPEPTSIENAYVFIKTALWKLIDTLGQRLGEQQAAGEVLQLLALNAPRNASSGYVDCFRKIYAKNPQFIAKVWELMKSRMIGIVINQTREQSDIDIGKSMEHLCARFFGFNTQYLGYLNYDESVWKSLRNRRMLVRDFPHSLIAKKVGKIASEIVFQLEKNGEKQ
jgi:flagellar biosynthesis protein FlhG